MVTGIEAQTFSGVIITGPMAGVSLMRQPVSGYQLIPDGAQVKVAQPTHEKRLGDVVVNDEGLHLVVTGIDTIPDNQLFAGVVITPQGPHYTGFFSKHWCDADFRLARRREELQPQAHPLTPSELYRLARERQNN